jgi:hypothetical protein
MGFRGDASAGYGWIDHPTRRLVTALAATASVASSGRVTKVAAIRPPHEPPVAYRKPRP